MKVADAAVEQTMAAVDSGATRRVGAANLHRIATILLDAVVLHNPGRLQQVPTFDKADAIYARAADLAARCDSPCDRLSADISLQRGLIALSRGAGTPGVPGITGPDGLKHWALAVEYLQDAVKVLGPERKLLTTEASGRLMTFVTLSVSLILTALHCRHADRDAAADRAFAGHGNERYGALNLRWTGTRAHKHSSMQLSAGWGRHKCNCDRSVRFGAF